MSSLAEPRSTPQQYLEIERRAPTKSEYVNGRIYAITHSKSGYPGASREHNLITGNVNRELSLQLRGRSCEAYASDMRVKVSATGMYTYPDVVAVCGEPHFEDEAVDTLTNPTLIVEVLSPSTEAYDRGAKFAHYRRVASLAEYVLVAQDRVSVERLVRQGEQWILSAVDNLDDVVRLASIDATLRLGAIYDKVTFAPDQAATPGDNKTI